jgi:Rap1a immunity proteins
MKRTLLFIIAYTACAAVDAGFDSGNRLYEDCRSENYFNRGYCGGYVTGIVDSIEAMQASGVLPESALCIPEGATKGQLADVVRQYLEDHPERRHADAGSLVPEALGRAFGCRH